MEDTKATQNNEVIVSKRQEFLKEAMTCKAGRVIRTCWHSLFASSVVALIGSILMMIASPDSEVGAMLLDWAMITAMVAFSGVLFERFYALGYAGLCEGYEKDGKEAVEREVKLFSTCMTALIPSCLLIALIMVTSAIFESSLLNVIAGMGLVILCAAFVAIVAVFLITNKEARKQKSVWITLAVFVAALAVSIAVFLVVIN